MTRAVDRMLWPFMCAATLLFVAWGLVPRAAVFTSVLSPPRLVAVAGLVKLSLLAAGAAWSWRARGALDPDNPVRAAWGLLAAGMLCNVIGQAVLARYQLAGQDAPFPSAGDVFYVLAYPLMGAALVQFVRAYDDAGYPLGTATERAVVMAVTTALCTGVSILVLRPVLQAEAAPMARVLNAAYPLLDMALLVPLVLLLRTTWQFRGGSVGSAWLIILSGFAFMCVGDVLFAYFSALGRTGLDPFVHASYVVSYGLIAAGVRRHLSVVIG
jgi:hypothetical protein